MPAIPSQSASLADFIAANRRRLLMQAFVVRWREQLRSQQPTIRDALLSKMADYVTFLQSQRPQSGTLQDLARNLGRTAATSQERAKVASMLKQLAQGAARPQMTSASSRAGIAPQMTSMSAQGIAPQMTSMSAQGIAPQMTSMGRQGVTPQMTSATRSLGAQLQAFSSVLVAMAAKHAQPSATPQQRSLSAAR